MVVGYLLKRCTIKNISAMPSALKIWFELLVTPKGQIPGRGILGKGGKLCFKSLAI